LEVDVELRKMLACLVVLVRLYPVMEEERDGRTEWDREICRLGNERVVEWMKMAQEGLVEALEGGVARAGC
jgi:hypothetical protein